MVDVRLIPKTECLKDTVARVLPYWYDVIVPEIKVGIVTNVLYTIVYVLVSNVCTSVGEPSNMELRPFSLMQLIFLDWHQCFEVSYG